MEAALRPHRGGTVLALGVLSLATFLAIVCLESRSSEAGQLHVLVGFVVVPLGLLACILGWRQSAAMRARRIDPAGRRKTRIGQVLGAAAVVLSVLLLAWVFLFFREEESVLMSDGTCVVTQFRNGHVPEVQYHEALGSDGHLVKEGLYVRWGHDGVKLEEGSYHEGKRLGEWTFRNEDGSFDAARSGYYANDVRVEGRAASSPPGDYPVKLPPAGYTQPR
jgi:hypothetical protein